MTITKNAYNIVLESEVNLELPFNFTAAQRLWQQKMMSKSTVVQLTFFRNTLPTHSVNYIR